MNHLNSINHLNEKFYNLKIFFCFPHNNDIWFCEFLYCNLFLLFSLLFNKRWDPYPQSSIPIFKFIFNYFNYFFTMIYENHNKENKQKLLKLKSQNKTFLYL